MGYVLGGLMASLSFLLNKLFIKLTGIETVLLYSPAVEEAAKTLPAHYLGADLLITHSMFGILEGVYDFITGTHKTAAMILSILGHTLFGTLTVLGRYYTGEIWLGLMGAVFIHIIWNITAIRLASGH